MRSFEAKIDALELVTQLEFNRQLLRRIKALEERVKLLEDQQKEGEE